MPLSGIASDGTSIYTLGLQGTVLSCPLTGCPGGLLQTFSASTSGGAASAIAVAPTSSLVVWTTTSNVEGCPTSGCANPQVLATLPITGDYLGGIAADATNVYFTDPQGGFVYSCPLSGCPTGPTILASGETSPSPVAVDESHVYWATPKEIHSCPVAGCASTGPAVIALNQYQPRAIAVDATAIYWTSSLPYAQVWKVAK